jgi:hypothetical protein
MAHFMSDPPRWHATAALNLRPFGEDRGDRNQAGNTTDDSGSSSRNADCTPTRKRREKYRGDVK